MPYDLEERYEPDYSTLQRAMGPLTPDLLGSASYRMRPRNVGPAIPELRKEPSFGSEFTGYADLPEADKNIYDFFSWWKNASGPEKAEAEVALLGQVLDPSIAGGLTKLLANKMTPMMFGTIKGYLRAAKLAGTNVSVANKLVAALKAGRTGKPLGGGAFGQVFQLKRYPEYVVKVPKRSDALETGEMVTIPPIQEGLMTDPALQKAFPKVYELNKRLMVAEHLPNIGWENFRKLPIEQRNEMFIKFYKDIKEATDALAMKYGRELSDIRSSPSSNFGITAEGKPQVFDLGIMYPVQAGYPEASALEMQKHFMNQLAKEMKIPKPELYELDRLVADYESGSISKEMLKDPRFIERYTRGTVSEPPQAFPTPSGTPSEPSGSVDYFSMGGLTPPSLNSQINDPNGIMQRIQQGIDKLVGRGKLPNLERPGQYINVPTPSSSRVPWLSGPENPVFGIIDQPVVGFGIVPMFKTPAQGMHKFQDAIFREKIKEVGKFLVDNKLIKNLEETGNWLAEQGLAYHVKDRAFVPDNRELFTSSEARRALKQRAFSELEGSKRFIGRIPWTPYERNPQSGVIEWFMSQHGPVPIFKDPVKGMTKGQQEIFQQRLDKVGTFLKDNRLISDLRETGPWLENQGLAYSVKHRDFRPTNMEMFNTNEQERFFGRRVASALAEQRKETPIWAARAAGRSPQAGTSEIDRLRFQQWQERQIPYNQRLGWSVEENIPGEYDLFGNRWRSPEESL